MDSSAVIAATQEQRLPVVEDNPHYRIHDCVVKEYPAWKLLVQSSGEPISLGKPMLPLMDSEALRHHADSHGIARRDDTPLEVYLYHWVEKAQGPMIFDVGFVVDDGCDLEEGDHAFILRDLPPLKMASIVYTGPFPYEEMSGWGNIHWEERAREKGLVYTEKLYRELYHHFDFESHWHIAEIQMSVE